MTQKETHAPIKNEASNGLKNDKYTVAMARTSDPDSATSQFLLIHLIIAFRLSRTRWCWLLCFAKVTEGFDVLIK